MEELIGHLIDRISNLERWIFVCYYYNHMSIEEIANETGFEKEIIAKHLSSSSNKVIKEIGEGGIYYAALIAFLSMGDEATNCRPPKNTKLIF